MAIEVATSPDPETVTVSGTSAVLNDVSFMLLIRKLGDACAVSDVAGPLHLLPLLDVGENTARMADERA